MLRFKNDYSQTNNLQWQVHKPGAGESKCHTYTKQQAAIMFTDIVGYTGMINKDEEMTLELLGKNREIQQSAIHQFDGLWIKEMGDGILSSFKSATNAIHCALHIQNSIENIEGLRLHIGIHLSKVIYMDQDVYGVGVNIASRIQQLAAPDKILVSGQVFKNSSCNQRISFRHMGPVKLKNVEKKVEIYQIEKK